jgi:outer membrane lipoprotein-sorting protein
MKPAILLAVFLCSTGALASARFAIDPTLSPVARGHAIAEAARNRGEGFVDSISTVNMTLPSAKGRKRTRRLTWQILEILQPNEGDKSLTIFHEPRDIAGTAFLSYTHVDQADDQWLYLPALKRVKRIASTNKSSAFVGSEFAYEDLLSDEVEKFSFRWLRDEACGEWQCFVIERRPLYEDSGYSRQIVWLDRDELRSIRIEYYDRKDRLKKTLVFEDYRLYLERFWRAQIMRMKNHQTGKVTVLEFGEFRFQTGLTEQDFDPSALRRLR